MLSRLGRLSVLCLHLNLFSAIGWGPVGTKRSVWVLLLLSKLGFYIRIGTRMFRFIHCVLSVGVGGVPAYFRREGLQ